MNKLLLPVLALLIFIVGCGKEEMIVESGDPITRDAMNKQVFETLNAEGEFRWSSVSDHFVWSALVRSDNILSIGYKPANVSDVHSIIHQIDINDAQWTAARNKVINTIKDILKDDPNFDAEKHIYVKDVLPVVIVHTNSFEVVQALRAMNENVRYAEPMGYSIEPDVVPQEGISNRSDSGCGAPGVASGATLGTDYTNLSPYSNKVSWTYSRMNVESAWNAGLSGDNVTVAMFDSGTSDDQYKLRGGFDDGYSSGRYISPRSTHWTTTGALWWKETTLDSPHDQCGHGTSMSGTICGARSSGTSTVGVAWEANLLAYRVTEDVIIGASSEKDGVSDAFVEVAQQGNAKIVSMSLGDVFSSGQVEDAVVYAYNYGVLIFAAAGTSLTWTSWYGVIFPASLSQTVAVTGVTDESNYSRCDACHDGSGVDFVVKMEKSNGNHAMTYRMSGNQPSWVGGSSTATAHTAGAAALISQKYGTTNRTTILNKLKNASQNYPSRSGSFGWGTYDLSGI